MQGLDGHLESIRGNINQVRGLTQAMAKGKAAVQAILLDHLETERYEEVILG